MAMDCNDNHNCDDDYKMWHEDKSGEKHMINYICDQNYLDDFDNYEEGERQGDDDEEEGEDSEKA